LQDSHETVNGRVYHGKAKHGSHGHPFPGTDGEDQAVPFGEA
jgi:hypothetical protein